MLGCFWLVLVLFAATCTGRAAPFVCSDDIAAVRASRGFSVRPFSGQLLRSQPSPLLIRGGSVAEVLTTAASAAKTSLSGLPLPLAGKHPLFNDVIVSLALAAEVTVWLRFWTGVAQRNILPSVVTRKIIHTGSAPLFVMHWPLFSQARHAPYVAACIPALQVLRLYVAGRGGWRRFVAGEGGNQLLVSDADQDGLVAAVSRTGRSEEAMGGPLLYSLVLCAATALCFRSSAWGVVAVSQMAAGDGIADIAGRQLGKGNAWSLSPQKSVAGSLGFVIGGWACTWLLLAWLQRFGYLRHVRSVFLGDTALGVAAATLVISALCAVVELFPVGKIPRACVCLLAVAHRSLCGSRRQHHRAARSSRGRRGAAAFAQSRVVGRLTRLNLYTNTLTNKHARSHSSARTVASWHCRCYCWGLGWRRSSWRQVHCPP